jgi:hypothetical protein
MARAAKVAGPRRAQGGLSLASGREGRACRQRSPEPRSTCTSIIGWRVAILAAVRFSRVSRRRPIRTAARQTGPDRSSSGLAGAKIAVISETPACLAGRNCALWGVAPRLRSTAERGAPGGVSPLAIRLLGGVLWRNRPTPALRLMACAAGCVDDEMSFSPIVHIWHPVSPWILTIGTIGTKASTSP